MPTAILVLGAHTTFLDCAPGGVAVLLPPLICLRCAAVALCRKALRNARERCDLVQNVNAASTIGGLIGFIVEAARNEGRTVRASVLDGLAHSNRKLSAEMKEVRAIINTIYCGKLNLMCLTLPSR